MNFHFVVPLKSARVSQDWPLVVALLKRTLGSIFGQTAGELRVTLVCHEVPPGLELFGERLRVLSVDFPPPAPGSPSSVTMPDKWRKLRRALREMREDALDPAGAGRFPAADYLMFVDADDLLSNRLCAHIEATRDPHGYWLTTGYRHREGSRWLRWDRHFDCGTNAVLAVAKLRLPEAETEAEHAACVALANGHQRIAAAMAAQGCPLAEVPFPAAIYVLGHGENDFRGAAQLGALRKSWAALRRVSDYRQLTRGRRAEFNLVPVGEAEPGLRP